VNDDLAISPLRTGDLPWVLALEVRSFLVPWSEKSFLDELTSSFAVALAAREASGEPVGFALGRLLFDEGHLLKIAVQPGLRRQGLGSRLLAAFEQALRDGGATMAVLEVRVGNTAARRMYERAGWTVVSERRRYYPDGEDGMLLSKRLQ
jgi:ribosomal-protein-alanine N-acetyltransferase